MTKNFYETVENRHSIYGLSDEFVISDERLQEVLHIAVKHAPSAFNSQTARLVVLLEDQNQEFWKQVFDGIKDGLSEERYERNKKRFEGFASGHGTVLVFEDEKEIATYQEKFSDLADVFPIFSQQSSGMLQYLVWTTLENEGFGASLQHYYPQLSEEFKKQWGIQEGWKLISEIPFGAPTESPKPKEYKPAEDMVFIVK